jgi:adenine phosphoribosyltransferase
VLISDDVIATGGTAVAARALVHALQGKAIGFAFIVEIGALRGREKLGNATPIHAVIRYDAAGAVTVSE